MFDIAGSIKYLSLWEGVDNMKTREFQAIVIINSLPESYAFLFPGVLCSPTAR
jgi:hypothetical protein